MTTTKTTLEVGDRVRLTRNVERYPHFTAPEGARGTVADLGDPAGAYISVRMDDPIPGAEEWDNEIVWDTSCENPTDDLEAEGQR